MSVFADEESKVRKLVQQFRSNWNICNSQTHNSLHTVHTGTSKKTNWIFHNGMFRSSANFTFGEIYTTAQVKEQ